MDVTTIRTSSLGDSTYVVTHNSTAIVVDPQRDVGRFLEVLGPRTLTHVLETHVHNDYVSGGRELSARTGADLVLPAGYGAAFRFVPAFHHEELESDDGLVIRPIHTPGHTPEHASYLVIADGEPAAVFTGGSLLVGSAGRPDLLGMEYAEMLARLQYGSLQRLAQLPDDTGVYPTHGEGSFCTSSGAGRTTSSIGAEKAGNPLYRIAGADEFVRNQLEGLGPYPAYYRHMGPINRLGPTPMPDVEARALAPDDVARHLARGGAVIDGRDRASFAAAHIRGALGIEIGDSFAPWTGWLVDNQVPIVLVLSDDQDAAGAVTELARIGFERFAGVLRGVDAWAASGREIHSHRTEPFQELASRIESGHQPQILDVRDPSEWKAGHIAGSVHRYVPDLLSEVPEELDRDEPVWVICASGTRSNIAAGLVERHGYQPVVIGSGGVPDVLSAVSAGRS